MQATAQVYLNFTAGDSATTTVATDVGHSKISDEICRSILHYDSVGDRRHEGVVVVDRINFHWKVVRTPFNFGPLTWWVIVKLVVPKHFC